MALPVLLAAVAPAAAAAAAGAEPAPRALRPLALGGVVPEGWLRAQLEAQRAGLAGNMHLGYGMYVNSSGHRSSWLGGPGGDSFESYPYWLNGALPMAVQLEDKELLAELRSQISFILDHASKNGGWLGPLDTLLGPWPSFRFCTCLVQYIDATGDQKAVAALWVFAQRLLAYLQDKPLVSWGRARWPEVVIAFQWLLDNYGATAETHQLGNVTELMKLAWKQGFDWNAWITSSPSDPFVKNMTTSSYYFSESRQAIGNDILVRQMPDTATHVDCEILCINTPGCIAYVWSKCKAARTHTCWLKSDLNGVADSNCSGVGVAAVAWFPENTRDADIVASNALMPFVDRHWTHGVNVAMAMTAGSALYRLTGDGQWLQRNKEAWLKILRTHGQATGVFSGDEKLAGLAPTRGTETCTVVEAMHSAGEMFLTTGDAWYADLLEGIALNALPAAAFNGTMWAINYHQQVNKLDAMDGQPGCERGCTYCYGMVFECCVTNHAQGWPKLAARMLSVVPADPPSRPQAGLACVLYFGARASGVQLGDGNAVDLHVDTRYPFAELVVFRINATRGFPFTFRVPSWCHGQASLELSGGEKLSELPSGLRTVPVPAGSSWMRLRLPMEIRAVRRPAYRPWPNTTVDAGAVNIWRGPLLYAMPRLYKNDRGKTWQENSSLLPQGQDHAVDHYLLGESDWAVALQLSDDGSPRGGMRYEERAFPVLPKGQGPFAESLVPGRIVAQGRRLSNTQWGLEGGGRRGSALQCAANTTSLPAYVTGWAGLPPQSPVKQVDSPLTTVTLVPYGATDLRIAEFPTVAEGTVVVI